MAASRSGATMPGVAQNQGRVLIAVVVCILALLVGMWFLIVTTQAESDAEDHVCDNYGQYVDRC